MPWISSIAESMASAETFSRHCLTRLAGCVNVMGRIMAYPNLMVDLPATMGALAPPVKGELGRELTML